MEVVVIAITIAVAGLVIYRSDRRQKRPRRKREAALRVIADSLGFTYTFEGDPIKQEPFLEQAITTASMHLAHAYYGTAHYLRGRGPNEPVTIFDVWHGGPAGSGKPDATNPWQLTMAAFRLEGARLPPLRIFPEGRADRVTDRILQPLQDTIVRGWRDLDFDDHPAFSQRYSLRSSDEDHTRKLFDDAFIAFWESLPEASRLGAAATGQSLVVYRDPPYRAFREGALAPDDYAAFIDEAERVVAAFRRVVEV